VTRYVAYLAVLPSYRQACIDVLTEDLGAELQLYACPAHLDPTVTTGISTTQYTQTSIRRIAGQFFIQSGHWSDVIRAQTAIFDLNPRSLSAWILLFARRMLGRRSLVWGHLHPRAGTGSRSAGLRRMMRRIASGTITYTYTQTRQARVELPGQPVWVAPNALYHRADLADSTSREDRNTILYVGRLEPAKKVSVLVAAFAEHAARTPGTRLAIVGRGSDELTLRTMIDQLGLEDRVELLGSISDVSSLRALYQVAFASASPGFAGLGLTQSLGFGIPQIVSQDETHSPEIELASEEAVIWFTTDDPNSLARQIDVAYARRSHLPLTKAARRIRETYSAEAMAGGLSAAIQGAQGSATDFKGDIDEPS
jgi:glycosyltransferase involved in cell wall biosynthesis